MDTPTPILAAVYRGNPDEIAAALGGRPAPTVFEAAALGDAARIRVLATIDAAAVAQRSPDGWPPLHLAAHFGHGDAVDALLEAKADVHARPTNAQRNTALHAALAGRTTTRIVSRLLASDADVNARNDDGQTPLDLAQAQGHAVLAR